MRDASLTQKSREDTETIEMKKQQQKQTTNLDQHELERTAYHEAGHAIIAYLFKRRFSYITIEATEHYSGKIDTQLSADMNHDLARWLFFNGAGFLPIGIGELEDVTVPHQIISCVQKEMMISYAGNAAEAIFKEEPRMASSGRLYRTSLADFRQADKLAASVTMNRAERNALCAWLQARTLQLLTVPTHWQAVEALAAALVSKRRLSYRQAREVIKASFAANIKQARKRFAKEKSRHMNERAAA